MQKHLIIFAKEPRMGRVKTRLARGMGAVAAWRFYRSMLHDIPRRLNRGGDWQVWLSVSPDAACLKTTLWPRGAGRAIRLTPQGSGDLGQRMWAPRRADARVVVVGTDIPEMQPHMIKQAFEVLRRRDFVFGPADDGGFWLVGYRQGPGLRNPYGRDVRWSHPDTLTQCLTHIQRQGQTVGLINVLSDVDDRADWAAWQDRQKSNQQ